jgi:hypothetical protein
MVRVQASQLPVVGAAYGKLVEKLPVVKQLADIGGVVPKSFFALSRVIEGVAQRAALGRSVRRDIQEFQGSWIQTVRLGDEAIAEAARGLTNTSTQARFMREQHKLLGQYEGFPPWMRRLTQGAMPFIPWMINAARFVFWTMPTQRTVQTALLAKTAQVVSAGWQEDHDNVPPGSLKLAIPTAKGGWLDLARYTPYGLSGAVVEGDLSDITSQAFPQLQGTVAALEGRDPFGRALRVQPTADNPKGEPNVGQKLLIAGNSLAEATVPYLAQARRLQEHGETAFADSTVLSPKTKPGSSHGMSAARRVFDPFRPTFLSSGGGASVVADGPAPRRALPAGLSQSDVDALRDAQSLAGAGGLSPEEVRALQRAGLAG